MFVGLRERERERDNMFVGLRERERELMIYD